MSNTQPPALPQNPWRNRVILIAALGLIAIVTFLVRDYVRQSVAPGVLYLLWLTQRLFISLPQAFWYALFLLAALILIARSLRQGRPTIKHQTPLNKRYYSRVEELTRLAGQAHHSDYFARRLDRQLADLTLEILGYEARLTPLQAQAAVEKERGRIPDTLYLFLQQNSSQRNGSDLMTPPPNRLITLAQRLRGRGPHKPTSTLADVIIYLEQQLEIK